MSIKFDLSNVDQDDRKAFLTLVDKMLRDAYLKGYNHGLTGKPPHKHYFGFDEKTGEMEDCMVCGERWLA